MGQVVHGEAFKAKAMGKCRPVLTPPAHHACRSVGVPSAWSIEHSVGGVTTHLYPSAPSGAWSGPSGGTQRSCCSARSSGSGSVSPCRLAVGGWW